MLTQYTRLNHYPKHETDEEMTLTDPKTYENISICYGRKANQNTNKQSKNLVLQKATFYILKKHTVRIWFPLIYFFFFLLDLFKDTATQNCFILNKIFELNIKKIITICGKLLGQKWHIKILSHMINMLLNIQTDTQLNITWVGKTDKWEDGIGEVCFEPFLPYTFDFLSLELPL